MILRLSLELPEDEHYVRITRILGRTLLEYLKVDSSDVSDMELVAGELCTNVLRHARSCEGRYSVELEYHADHVDLTVSDRGPGFSFVDLPEAGTIRADTLKGGERIGGYGMTLIRALSDRLEFHRIDSVGTSVQARINLHYQTPEAAGHAESLDNGNASIEIQTD